MVAVCEGENDLVNEGPADQLLLNDMVDDTKTENECDEDNDEGKLKEALFVRLLLYKMLSERCKLFVVEKEFEKDKETLVVCATETLLPKEKD